MTGIGPVQPGSSKSAAGDILNCGISGSADWRQRLWDFEQNLPAARLYQATTFAVDYPQFHVTVSDLPP